MSRLPNTIYIKFNLAYIPSNFKTSWRIRPIVIPSNRSLFHYRTVRTICSGIKICSRNEKISSISVPISTRIKTEYLRMPSCGRFGNSHIEDYIPHHEHFSCVYPATRSASYRHKTNCAI